MMRKFLIALSALLIAAPAHAAYNPMGPGVATFLRTPSSSNLATAVTGETGSGALVFGTTPTIATPNLTGAPTIGDPSGWRAALVVPGLAVSNTFTLPQIVNIGGGGAVSPRMNNGLQVMGTSGENNGLDMFAVDGFQQTMHERYHFNSGIGWLDSVEAYKAIGGPGAAAYACDPDGGDALTAPDNCTDPYGAGVIWWTTEAQDVAGNHQGVGGCWTYTPNASTALKWGLCVSPTGLGGVTVSSANGSIAGDGSVTYSATADLGAGSLHVEHDVATGNHFRSLGGFGDPSVSSCGGGSPSVIGTDNAGVITTGTGSPTACTLTFAQQWKDAGGSALTPVCIVQTRGNASPVSYISSDSSTAITITFSAGLSGGVNYICQSAE